jgi:hypothetical protein
MRYENCMPSHKVRSRKHFNNIRDVGNGVLPVEGRGWCIASEGDYFEGDSA